jgi:four helix bundle protein
MMSENKNILTKKSFAFAVRIIKLYQYLPNEKKEFVLSKQLLRSGTAIGALIREAQNAESKPDFIHKLGVAQKECDETIYWLELLKEACFLNQQQYLSICNEAKELLKMIRSAIITSKKNYNS